MARAYRTTAKNLAGMTFGKLSAIEQTRVDTKLVWSCRCSCGVDTLVSAANLLRGNTRSCGCLRHETTFRHGATINGTATKEYSAWTAMRRRCENPKNPKFHRYGARGISVCARWTYFENFLADMGPCPAGLTLERSDNDRGYEPGNCRWATYSEQNHNTSQNRYLTYGGQTRCIQDWCKQTGMTRNDINRRLRKGWPDEKILTTPVHRRAPRLRLASSVENI